MGPFSELRAGVLGRRAACTARQPSHLGGGLVHRHQASQPVAKLFYLVLILWVLYENPNFVF